MTLLGNEGEMVLPKLGGIIMFEIIKNQQSGLRRFLSAFLAFVLLFNSFAPIGAMTVIAYEGGEVVLVDELVDELFEDSYEYELPEVQVEVTNELIIPIVAEELWYGIRFNGQPTNTTGAFSISTFDTAVRTGTDVAFDFDVIRGGSTGNATVGGGWFSFGGAVANNATRHLRSTASLPINEASFRVEIDFKTSSNNNTRCVSIIDHNVGNAALATACSTLNGASEPVTTVVYTFVMSENAIIEPLPAITTDADVRIHAIRVFRIGTSSDDDVDNGDGNIIDSGETDGDDTTTPGDRVRIASGTGSVTGAGTGVRPGQLLADLTDSNITAVEFNATRYISTQTANGRFLSYMIRLSNDQVVGFITSAQGTAAGHTGFNRLNFGVSTFANATAGGGGGADAFSVNRFSDYSSVLTAADTVENANNYIITIAIVDGQLTGNLTINGTLIASLDIDQDIPVGTTISSVYQFTHSNTITIQHTWSLYDRNPGASVGEPDPIEQGAAPTIAPDVRVDVGTSGTVVLSWDAVPDAADYVVNGGGLVDYVTTTRTTTITGLTNGNAYTFTVFARNAYGDGPVATVAVTPIDSPLTATGGAWLESAYAYWTGVVGASYNVYVRSGGAWTWVNNPAQPVVGQSVWTNDHSPLVRIVDATTNQWRVDVPGLRARVVHELRIVEIETGREAIVTDLVPSAFDRQGFAFDPTSPWGTTTGAYNTDGTLRNDAVVIYVTAENVNTFTTPWGTTGIGGANGLFHENNVRNRTGANVGSMIDATPVAIRLIGDVPTPATVRTGNMIRVARSANLTFEGIGTDAIISGWGLNIMSSNVVVRNLTFIGYPDDAINLEGWAGTTGQWPTIGAGLLAPSSPTGNRVSTNIWITQNTFIDNNSGDGAIDASNNSSYFTIGWNRVYDGGRLANLGTTQNNIRFRGTVHSNFVSNNHSRVPRVRWGQVHFYNNVIDGASLYAIGAGHHASIIAEGNYFIRANAPMMISNQGAAVSRPGNSNNVFTGDYPGYLITTLTGPTNHAGNPRGTNAIFNLAASLKPNEFVNITTFDPILDQGLPAPTNLRNAQPFQYFNPRTSGVPVNVTTAREALNIVPLQAGAMTAEKRSVSTIPIVPATPANPTAELNDGVIRVEWSLIPDAQRFYIRHNGVIISDVPGTQNYFEFTLLSTAGTLARLMPFVNEYHLFQIQSRNTNGFSAWSAEFTIDGADFPNIGTSVDPELGTPEATTTHTFIVPEIIAAENIVGDTQLNGTWTDGFFTAMGVANNGRWRAGQGGGVFETGQNGAGYVEFTTTSVSTVTFYASSTGGGNWSAVTLWNDAGEAQIEATGRLTIVDSGSTGTRFTFENLPPGTWRVVSNGLQYMDLNTTSVAATAGVGRGVRIHRISVVQTFGELPIMDPMDYPTDLVATSDLDRQVPLSWTPVANAIRHEYRYRAESGTWSTWATTSARNSHTVTDLINGTTFEFQVRGHDGTVYSVYSMVTATPVSLPLLQITGISAGATYNFGEVAHDFTASDFAPLTITVTNNGTAPALNTVVTLGGTSFVLTGDTEQSSLVSGASMVFEVAPRLLLVAGLHTDVVTISANGLANITFNVNFNVTPQAINAEWGRVAYDFDFTRLPVIANNTLNAGMAGGIAYNRLSEVADGVAADARIISQTARHQDFDFLIGGNTAANGFGVTAGGFLNPNGGGRFLQSSEMLQAPIRIELDVVANMNTGGRSSMTLYFGYQSQTFTIEGTAANPGRVVVEFATGEGYLRTSQFTWGGQAVGDPIGRGTLQAIRIFEGQFNGAWIETNPIGFELEFPRLPYDYTVGNLTTEIVQITNIGTEATEISATVGSEFEIIDGVGSSAIATATLEPKQTVLIAISPVTNLPTGRHVSSLIVEAHDANTLNVPVSVSINAPLSFPNVPLFYSGFPTSSVTQFPNNVNENVAWDNGFRRVSFTAGSQLMRFNAQARDADTSLAIPFMLNELLWVPMAAAEVTLQGTSWSFNVTTDEVTVTAGTNSYTTLTLVATTNPHGGNAIFVPLQQIAEALNIGNIGWDNRSNTLIVVTGATVEQGNVLYNNINDRPEQWYGSQNSIAIATNFVYMQRQNGGWPRGIGQTGAAPHQPDVGGMAPNVVQQIAGGFMLEDSYFGRGITTNETRFLLRMYEATGITRFRDAGLRGFDTIIRTQDSVVGGWPYQISGGSYHRGISISDNAIDNILWLLWNIETDGLFADTLGVYRVEQAIDAGAEGLRFILESQVVSNAFADGQSRLTAWPFLVYQSGLTYADLQPGAIAGMPGQPAWAREFEPPAISADESVPLIEFLMSIPDPSQEIRNAIHAAVYFFEYTRIDGFRLHHNPTVSGTTMHPQLGRWLEPEEGARPLWSRFIDIDTFMPLFYDRSTPGANDLLSPHAGVSRSSFEAEFGTMLGYMGTHQSHNATQPFSNTSANSVRNGTRRNVFRAVDGSLSIDPNHGEFDLVASFHNLTHERRMGFNYINHFGESLPAMYADWRVRVGLDASTPPTPEVPTPIEPPPPLTPPNYSWRRIGNQWFFYRNGVRQTGWVQTSDGSWYFMNNQGVMQTGWVRTGGSWFFMSRSGRMQTGWVRTGGNWFFMNRSGRMQTGWIHDGNGWYYLNNHGAMQTDWVRSGGSWFFMNRAGRMQTGWVRSTGGNWFFMNRSGRMQTGWIHDGNGWYYLNNQGVMQTGWNHDGNGWYFMNRSGRMQTGWVRSGGSWFFMNRAGRMQTGWVRSDGNWFFMNNDGRMQIGRVVIGGITHRFDNSGYWLGQ